MTYDITAWNLMYAYDLKGFATTERIAPSKNYQAKAVNNQLTSAQPYVYIFKYQSLKDVEFVTTLMQKNVKMRTARKSFSINGQNFEPGTILIPRRHNEQLADFDNIVQSTAKEFGRSVYSSSTGFMDKGKDVGSGDVNFLKAPKVAALIGEQTFSLSAGEVWNFFEQQIHYPITQIGTDYFKNVDLKKYDILVVPEGNYRLFDDAMLETISGWVSGGGRLVLIGNALNAFAEKPAFSLKFFSTEAEKNEAERKDKDYREKEALARFEDAERKQLSDYISGAIYKVSMDKSHPLAYGLNDNYYSLKTNELRFGFLQGGWNVGVLKGKAKPVQGFAGYRANKRLDNSLVFGVEDKGQGKVIYLVDNPLFRMFWENGKMVFANAVFMVGQ